MKKGEAVALLGGTVTKASRAVGVTSQAVTQWPDELGPTIRDRVLAALVRRYMGEGALLAVARAAREAEDRANAPNQMPLALDA